MDPTEAVERLWPGRQVRVTSLSGGITNHNFRVDVEGESFVLRMGGAETELLGIDRRTEREANHRAFEVGIAPHVVGFAEPEGWLVTRFIRVPIVGHTPASLLLGPRPARRRGAQVRALQGF